MNPQEFLGRIPTLREINFVNLKKKKVMKINQPTTESFKAKALKIELKGRF